MDRIIHQSSWARLTARLRFRRGDKRLFLVATATYIRQRNRGNLPNTNTESAATKRFKYATTSELRGAVLWWLRSGFFLAQWMLYAYVTYAGKYGLSF